MRARLIVAIGLLALALGAQAHVDPKGVSGTCIIGGGGKLPDAVMDRFYLLAGGDAAKVVVIPTASQRADVEERRAELLARLRADRPQCEFTLLHTRDRAVADSEEFCAPLRAATGVWIGGGQQRRLSEAYAATRVERELHNLLERGGVVGGTSAGAAIQTRVMIQSGKPVPVIGKGFDFVPHAIVDQHFTARDRLPRLRNALLASKACFGIGVDERTALEVSGRRLRVLGDGKVTLLLPARDGFDERVLVLGKRQRQDLVTWQRAAIGRDGDPWPAAPMPKPVVPSGALVIVGGGRLPASVIDRFVALAGGEGSKIVLVPGAAPRPQKGQRDRRLGLRAAIEGRGARVSVLDCEHPSEVTDAALSVLDDANGIWFGGGRQWRLCDAFEGTVAIERMRAVLTRGGVIGGSSAGATIQGEFLVRGNPLGNTDMWCEGYDRGFAFLPGCAIDQHFIARNRVDDLAQLIVRTPSVIGLGIDEGTAAIVQKGEFEVVGESRIAVFDLRQRDPLSELPVVPEWLAPGERWDLPAGRRKR